MTLEQRRRKLFPLFRKALRAVDDGESRPRFASPYLNKLIDSYAHGVSERQIIISFNKWVHNFNTEDVGLDLAYMVGEVSEVLEAHAKGEVEHTLEELADVVVYCYGIAHMLGDDLDKAIAYKMEVFRNRDYQKVEESK